MKMTLAREGRRGEEIGNEGMREGRCPSNTQGTPSEKLKEHRYITALRQWADRGWIDLVPKCGGCLSPTMTIRLLGSFILVSGVMVSSAEGSLLIREEQKYQRCILRQLGMMGSRHLTQPHMGNDEDMMQCYPNNINLVRSCAGSGVILLVILILCTMLMFVSVATERWYLSLPFGYGCVFVGLQELILVVGCWSLLGLGDLVVYAIHIFLLVYSAASIYALLELVRREESSYEDV